MLRLVLRGVLFAPAGAPTPGLRWREGSSCRSGGSRESARQDAGERVRGVVFAPAGAPTGRRATVCPQPMGYRRALGRRQSMGCRRV